MRYNAKNIGKVHWQEIRHVKKDDVGLAPVKSSNFWLVEHTILDLQQILDLKGSVASYDSPKMSGNKM